MKKTFTNLIAAIALLVFMTPSLAGWGQTNSTYTKVTSAPSDWSGEYLLVYESGTTAYVWTGVDGGSCYKTATLANTITIPQGAVSLTIASMTGGYSIMVNGGTNNGKYISGTSGSNTLVFGTTAVLNSISIESNSAKIVSNTSVLRFNSNSDQMRFRYFKSASYSSQKVVQLYKLDASTTTPSITISGAEISNNTVNLAYDDEEAYTANVAYDNFDSPSPTLGIYLNANCTELYEGQDFYADFATNDIGTIEYSFLSANSSTTTPRTVYIRVSDDDVNSNVVAITQAAMPTYTVTYNANGATGNAPSDAMQYTPLSNTVAVLGNVGSPALAKTGYTWSGWCLDADGTGTVYGPGDGQTQNYTITENTTFYAKWVPNKHSYTLSVTGGSYLDEDVEIFVPNQTGWVSGAQIEYGQQVTVSVIPLGGYTYTTTVTEGSNNVPVEQDMFTMPDGDVTILVIVEKLNNVTYDFSKIPGFNTWGNSYNEHTVTYDEAVVTFTSANHQTGTITDIPVTTGRPVSIVMKAGQPNITGVTFNCRQWGTKAQTITLHYSTDGGVNYTSTNITSNNFTISCAALPSGTNAVKITFSSTSNQVGIESATLNFSTDPVISVNPTSLTGFVYNQGYGPSESQTFTVSGNNLTNSITLALPSSNNFEMSIDETVWTNLLTLVPANGAVAATSVYVHLKNGLVEHSYSENISVTSGDLASTVSLSGTVNPAPVNYTYTAATSITPGKHYIIVGFNSGQFAMGGQNPNNRAVVNVSEYYHSEDDEFSIPSNASVFEFVISGDATNKYSIYDVTNNGYLYAVYNQNYLRNKETLENDGKWSINKADGEIDDNMIISAIVSNNNSTETRTMQFNTNNSIFSCYTTTQAVIYLYERTDDDCHIYSATNISDDMTVEGDMNIHAGAVTVGTNATLTVGGTLTNNAPANLIIEDGGQLIVNNAGVMATMKKPVEASEEATKGDAVNNYYTISSPVKDLTISSFLSTQGAYKHNIYRYDAANTQWQDYRIDDNEHYNFTSFTNGQGYLFRTLYEGDITYSGEINVANQTFTLSYDAVDELKSFNLIGNPFSHNIYKNDNYQAEGDKPAINDANLATGYYRINGGATWVPTLGYGNPILPGEGVLVLAKGGNGSSLAITNTTNFAASYSGEVGAKSGDDNLMFTVSNDQFEDVTYALFCKGYGLNKINHRSDLAPMIYIPQYGENFAIAMMDDNTNSFNLNFEAKTAGRYTLSFKANGEFNYLHVIDRMTGEDVDMLLEGEYSFIGSPMDNANRFIVRLGYMPNYDDNGEDIFAYQNGNDIVVSGEGELQIFDVMGRMVSAQRVNGVETINVKAQGVYIFKLNEKTQKIVVK